MTARITVVGLGPGPQDAVTNETLKAIARTPVRFLRTTHHPTASLVGNAQSFDHLYDTLDTFEEVYAEIVERLVASAVEHGEVLYAVPGSPLVLESSVRHLVADSRVEVVIVPALSFLDIAWQMLGIDPVEAGVRLIDGHRFAIEAAGERGPLLVAQVHADWVLSMVKLAHEMATGDEPVYLLHHLGLPDQAVIHTTWKDLDRTIEPDHLTTLYVPTMAAPIAGEMQRLHQLARTLRERCPWDRDQTHQTLVKHLLEESYEVVDAIHALNLHDGADQGDDALIEELGDLLYQVEFHATIAEQEGRFSMADIAQRLHDKLVRRHPHVFGDVIAETADDVVDTWDSVKRAERTEHGDQPSVFDGVAAAAPSLAYAQKIQKRAAQVGFDWPNVHGALAKIAEEASEVARSSDTTEREMELGDVLFSVVNVARHLGVDAEVALRKSSDKFRKRFVFLEDEARAKGIDLASLSLDQFDALWDEAKSSFNS